MTQGSLLSVTELKKCCKVLERVQLWASATGNRHAEVEAFITAIALMWNSEHTTNADGLELSSFLEDVLGRNQHLLEELRPYTPTKVFMISMLSAIMLIEELLNAIAEPEHTTARKEHAHDQQH